MPDAVAYHRVGEEDGDTEERSAEDERRQCTPASLSWSVLLLLWLLTILATALLTRAFIAHIASNSTVDSHIPLTSDLILSTQPPTTTTTTTTATPATPTQTTPWPSDLPSLTLLLRTYSANYAELLHFHFTFAAHWPSRLYAASGLVVVLDDERASDRPLGALLLQAWDGGWGDGAASRVGVAYEAMPGAGILSDKWRGSIGYCRQQYSNFYSDLYTDRDYIGIVDTDAYFIRPPSPADLFERTPARTYRPVLLGFNGNTLWCAAAEYMVGRPCAGDFMVSFPFIVQRAHLAPMRQHIVAHLNATSFEMAWRRMLTDVGDDMRREYSQFCIMATYLWHYHHDEYAWRINGMRDKQHKRMPKLLYDAQNETAMAASPAYRVMATAMSRYDIPTAHYIQHPSHTPHIATLTALYNSLCTASRHQAADCATHPPATRAAMRRSARQQWYTDEDAEHERVWVSERAADVERNVDAVVDGVGVYYAGRWRRYVWPNSGDGGGAGSDQPFVFRPHRVSYNASDGTFHEPDKT